MPTTPILDSYRIDLAASFEWPHGQAQLWNWQTKQLVCPPMDHPDEVMDVSLTPDARWGLTACLDGKVRLWEFTTGKLLHLRSPVVGETQQVLRHRNPSALRLAALARHSAQSISARGWLHPISR